MEAARKEFSGKREIQAIGGRQQRQRRKEVTKFRTMKVPVTVPSKAAQFAPAVRASIVETMPVMSFVSVHGDESHDTPPPSTEAAFGSCGNAERKNLTSSGAQKFKNEKLETDRLSVGSNCSNSSQKRQESLSSHFEIQNQGRTGV